MFKLRVCIGGTLCLAVLASLSFSSESPPATNTASPVSQPGYTPLKEPADEPAPFHSISGKRNGGWTRRHEALVEQAKNGGIDACIIGDSLVDEWLRQHKTVWDSNLGGWKVANFGLRGNRTQHVLWQIENGVLDGFQAKVIVVQVGTHNLETEALEANSVEDTARAVRKIVDLIQKKQPQATVFLMAVFPRKDKPVESAINELNALNSKLDDGKQVRFLNINDKLSDSVGNLLPEMVGSDKILLSDKGYQVWANELRPIFTEKLGPPAAE
jgi:lysophospholipase L1-like esterase